MDSSTTSSEPNLSEMITQLLIAAQSANMPILVALQGNERMFIASNTPSGTPYGIFAALHRLQEAA